MCRFSFYLGRPIVLSSLVTEPAHSVVHQSFQSREREDPINADGFGVAWYAPEHSPDPAVFKSVNPAWSNRNLHDLARVVASHCILAHVRAATQQLEVSEVNCHPFTRGPFAFMHNGDAGGFRKWRRQLLAHLSPESFDAIHGTTDSEHLFALLFDEIRRRNGEVPSVDTMADALRLTIDRVLRLARECEAEEHFYLNLVLTDGASAVACRFTTDSPANADSLYLNEGMRYVCESGVCRMLASPDEPGAVIVSSEPLSEDPGWHEIPVNALVKISRDRSVTIEQCGVG
ncbi:MAG TPA: class II glutamine amidotransferase [Thermoanaerobaculia bacterium]|nr:class II glutamine amidotransferase [Thermoanaerobaculia bacterium]